MDIGSRIKKYREEQNISQEELALKIFVSRQTISNWETDKSYPDIKSLIMLSNIFNVSLDNFIKKDIEEMRKIIDSKKVKEFNVMSYVFLVEMLVLIISAYPLFKFLDFIGFIIWISLYIISFGTASIIERFKKENNIQTYKEIIAFIDGKKLTYEETQQEIGKRMYQKIILAFVTGIITFIICLIMMFIMKKF
jgi:transcriptional regulator with XRE-family HTH domain